MILKFVILFLVTSAARSHDESKIIRGYPADRIRSFVVGVSKDAVGVYGFTCMANILTEKYFLTTCHCTASFKIRGGAKVEGLQPDLYPEDKRFIVFSERSDFRRGLIPQEEFEKDWRRAFRIVATNQVLSVTQGIPHAKCWITRWIWLNDIGILVSEDQLILKQGWKDWNYHFVFFNHLDFAQELYKQFEGVNKTCHTYGWGTLRQLVPDPVRKNFSTTLMEVEQVIVNWTTCMNFCEGMWDVNLCADHRVFPGRRTHDKYCAYRTKGQTGGPCYGDTGAALLCSDPELPEAEYAVGILVGSLHCGQFHGGPFFYYKLLKYLDFLGIFHGFSGIRKTETPAPTMSQPPSTPPMPEPPSLPPPPPTKRTVLVLRVICNPDEILQFGYPVTKCNRTKVEEELDYDDDEYPVDPSLLAGKSESGLNTPGATIAFVMFSFLFSWHYE